MKHVKSFISLIVMLTFVISILPRIDASAKKTKSATSKTKTENKYASSKIGDIIKFGSYEQDNDMSNGKEPIEWIVLDKTDTSLFLLSKYALDCQPYNTDDEKNVWETSTLRKWLNSTFYDAAFNKTEKNMIKKTVVNNEYNSGGKDTKDKVFLLSGEEVRNRKYGFEFNLLIQDVKRRCAPTKYAKAQGARQYSGTFSGCFTADNIGACSWWLRSPAGYSEEAMYCGWDGSADTPNDDGYYGTYVKSTDTAVRPALYINVNSSTESKTDKKDSKSNNKDKTTKKDSKSNKSDTTKKSENKYSSSKKGDIVKFGSYEQDSYYSNGKEPIEWIVLEKTDTSLFLLSKYALDCQHSNDGFEEFTWETSTLRKWLNATFYDAAFNKTEKSMIKETTVKNEDNPYYGTEGGKDTKDKVFLLSISEVTNTKYGFDSDSNAWDINRRCSPTDYAITRGANQYFGTNPDYYTVDKTGGCIWWLRSPGGTGDCYASHVGQVGELGVGCAESGSYSVAVRPALYIDLKS